VLDARLIIHAFGRQAQRKIFRIEATTIPDAPSWCPKRASRVRTKEEEQRETRTTMICISLHTSQRPEQGSMSYSALKGFALPINEQKQFDTRTYRSSPR
jgi:hypothetical protein